MLRIFLAILSVMITVTACTTPVDPNKRHVFRISNGDVADIQLRDLDAVNAIRQASGLEPVQLSAQLNAAAKTHAVDISNQNRPWHFGSDGSNPLQRVERTGYAGSLVAENISETFESDVETLQAWMRDPTTREGILRPDARYLGFSWHQESSGKIWWVQLFGN